MASRGVNKVILVGNLGADPEMRQLNSGGSVTTIKLATSESWKDKHTGQQQERTEWHRVKFFGRLAEIASEYLRKGSQVYIEGSIRTDKYTDKDGVERYTTDIMAAEMQMLGTSPGRQGESNNGDERSQPRSQQNQPSRSGYARQERQPAPAMAGDDPFDEGVPF